MNNLLNFTYFFLLMIRNIFLFVSKKAFILVTLPFAGWTLGGAFGSSIGIAALGTAWAGTTALAYIGATFSFLIALVVCLIWPGKWMRFLLDLRRRY